MKGLPTLLSDRKDKTDIQKLGKDEDTGIDMYAYRYKDDPKTYPKVVCPIAQDIERKAPGSTKKLAAIASYRETSDLDRMNFRGQLHMPFKKGDQKIPNSGRKPGVRNKNTAEVKVLALKAVPKIVKELERLSTKAINEATRVAAAKELLDRAIGKAVQPHSGETGEGPIEIRHVVSWQK